MICPNCGKEYNEKMTCCISCGADLVPYEQETEQTFIEPLIPEAETIAKIPETEFVHQIERNDVLPTTEEIEIPVKAKKSSLSFSSAAKFSGSLAVSVLMLAFILLSAAAATLRLVTDKEIISEFTGKLDVMSLPAAQTVIPSEAYGIAADATVQEAIFVMSDGTGLTRDDIRTIYEASTMKDFLASQLTGYAEFIRSGNVPEKLTSEKLKSVFSENLGLIGNAMGKPLSQHDINLAFAEIDKVQPALDKISPANIESSFGGNLLTLIRLFGSMPVIVGTAALAAAMFPLLGVINRKGARVLLWGGSAILTGGAAVLAATFLFSVQVPFSGQDRLVKSLAKCAADVISPDLYRIGAALAIFGVLLLIWAGTLRKSRSAA